MLLKRVKKRQIPSPKKRLQCCKKATSQPFLREKLLEKINLIADFSAATYK